MKLDYKILWLDDKIQELFIDDEYIDEIDTYLKEEGFNPKIVAVSKEEDFFAKLDDSYDLILTDYHLNRINGDEIVKQVREKSILTEIMFYTAQADLVDTVKKDRITFLETRALRQQGSHQEVLVLHLKGLIGLTIKKFQHIVAMRGMIMNETSSLDLQMLEIIKGALKNEKIKFEELATNIYDELNKLYASKIEFVNECKKSNRFNKLTTDTFVFSAEYKIKTLGQILASLELTDFSEDYKTEINSIRNKFAHAILLKDEKGREYFKHGESGLTFDENLCRKIRQDINKHRINFENTMARISEK
jgi:CheY-like chemotaxis protein